METRLILLNLPRNRQIKTETGPRAQASPAKGTGGSGDENGLPSRPPSGTALGRLSRYDKTSQLAFFNQYYLLLKAGARGSPVNVSFGQESPGTKQGTTTRIGTGLRCHYCNGNEKVKSAKGLGNVHTIPNRICVGTKTILLLDRASVHTRLWRRDFCDGAKMRSADL